MLIAFTSESDPLDFIKRHLVGLAIIELRRARAGVVRHQRRIFERSAELAKHRNARGAERVIADARLDPGSSRGPTSAEPRNFTCDMKNRLCTA